MVEDPLLVIDAGLNAAVTPVGIPLTERPAVPAKPLSAETVAVYGALWPAITVWLNGVTLSEKSGAAFTVSETPAVWLRFPLVAVTVSEYVPGDVVEAVVTVMVEDPLPVIVLGLNAALTPLGIPL